MKQLHVAIREVYVHNSSENGDPELDLQLIFDNLSGIGSIRLPRITTNSLRVFYQTTLPWEDVYYPLVAKNRFTVQFKAVEHDGPDPDDRASGTITIDLDVNGWPPSSWVIIAASDSSDLNVRIKFDIITLSYAQDPFSSGSTIQGSVYPWSHTTVFEHALGLGKNGALIPTSGTLHREYDLINIHTGKRMTHRVHRFDRTHWNLADNAISSVFARANLTLYEHHFSDPRFASGKRLHLSHQPSGTLHNLRELVRPGWNPEDSVSAIEMTVIDYHNAPN